MLHKRALYWCVKSDPNYVTLMAEDLSCFQSLKSASIQPLFLLLFLSFGGSQSPSFSCFSGMCPVCPGVRSQSLRIDRLYFRNCPLLFSQFELEPLSSMVSGFFLRVLRHMFSSRKQVRKRPQKGIKMELIGRLRKVSPCL